MMSENEWMSDAEHAAVLEKVLIERFKFDSKENLLSRLPDQFNLKQLLLNGREDKRKEEIHDEDNGEKPIYEEMVEEHKTSESEQILFKSLLDRIHG